MAQDTSVMRGMVWMLVISILLFWFPLGPLLAGLVGGKKAGGVGSGLMAAILPGVAVAVLLLFFSTALTGVPLVGVVIGALGGLYYLAGVGMLLLGAIIGGLLA